MWKRTRAIRKDITQQHLNCRTTAEVLEIVARYHIWCAHALAKEDRSVFSAKINNENLEKTMTSIEQNYQGMFYYRTSMYKGGNKSSQNLIQNNPIRKRV